MDTEGAARASTTAHEPRREQGTSEGVAGRAARAAGEGAIVPLLLDFETTSKADLRTVGGRLYAEHPTTRPLVCVMHDTESGATGAWFPEDGPVALDGDCGAHNWDGFDRHIAARLGWGDFPHAVDTSVLARRAGLPGALDALGSRWLGRAKDKVASRFTVGLSKYADIADAPPPSPPPVEGEDKKARARARTKELKAWRTRPSAERRAHVLEIVTRYCASDVEIMAQGWPRLAPFLTDGVFGSWEADVLAAHRAVNDRGIAFDSDLARRLLDADTKNAERVSEIAAKACGWNTDQVRTVVGSPVQLADMLGTPDAKADTIEAFLQGGTFEHAEWQIRLCEARQAVASIVRGKLEAGLARVSPDGRIRDGHKYYGAHTGRDSHKGLQMGNMTRPPNTMPTHGGKLPEKYADWGDDEISRLVDLCFAGEGLAGEEIEVLLRACLLPSLGGSLAVCDFSSVEARWIAWTAGDAQALDVFRSGKIPYKVAAATIFGIAYDDVVKGSDEYDIGKKAELSCSYGMGAKKFEFKYQPSRVGVDAADIVKGWRELHAPIVKYWHVLEDAFVDAVRGTARSVWPYEFVPGDDGSSVAIFLPSGRPIVYNQTGLSREVGFNGRTKFAPYYVGTKGHREHLYGGKIAENVTQAGCRDLMMAGLVQAERDGLAPVLRVHDEIVCDVPRGEEGYRELKDIMLTLPEWAEGFPVGAAGHWGKRYRK